MYNNPWAACVLRCRSKVFTSTVSHIMRKSCACYSVVLKRKTITLLQCRCYIQMLPKNILWPTCKRQDKCTTNQNLLKPKIYVYIFVSYRSCIPISSSFVNISSKFSFLDAMLFIWQPGFFYTFPENSTIQGPTIWNQSMLKHIYWDSFTWN